MYVNFNVYGLKPRGEQMDYLMINLFKAYHVASDGEFVGYINTKRYQYNNGYNISPDKLMTSTLNKFKILKKDNKWNSMSPEQEQIVALAYVVEKLKDNNIKISKSFKISPPVKVKGKGKVKLRGQVKRLARKKSQYGKGKEEWNKQEQKDGEANTKKVNNKT